VFKLDEVDGLHFSPRYRFFQLDFENKELLVDAVKDRVCGFYLNPAKQVNENRSGFA